MHSAIRPPDGGLRESQRVIAKQLRCGRDTVNTAVKRIHRAFIAAGLRAWIDPNRE